MLNSLENILKYRYIIVTHIHLNCKSSFIYWINDDYFILKCGSYYKLKPDIKPDGVYSPLYDGIYIFHKDKKPKLIHILNSREICPFAAEIPLHYKFTPNLYSYYSCVKNKDEIPNLYINYENMLTLFFNDFMNDIFLISEKHFKKAILLSNEECTYLKLVSTNNYMSLKILNEKLLNEFICCTEDEFINKRDEIYKLGRYVIDKINSIYDLDTKNKIKFVKPTSSNFELDLTHNLNIINHFLYDMK